MSVESIVNPLQYPTKVFTLVVVRNKDLVLLGYKKRGFGVNKWNGFGGKVEQGETILEAAKRELWEECGLTAKTLVKHGVLWFTNDAWPDHKLLEVHLFTATEYEGEITETEEMKPKWFTYQEIPYGEMWTSSQHWLPRVLKETKFDAFFHYGPDDRLLDFKISERS